MTISTGWWGIPGGVASTSTKVHINVDGKPACGCKVGARQEYQWCSHGVQYSYLDCGNCKRVARRMNHESRKQKIVDATEAARASGKKIGHMFGLAVDGEKVVLQEDRCCPMAAVAFYSGLPAKPDDDVISLAARALEWTQCDVWLFVRGFDAKTCTIRKPPFLLGYRLRYLATDAKPKRGKK